MINLILTLLKTLIVKLSSVTSLCVIKIELNSVNLIKKKLKNPTKTNVELDNVVNKIYK